MGCIRRCGTLVLVATVAVMMTVMATTAVAATRAVALLRQADAMAMCDGDKVRTYAADNGSACTIAKQFART